MNPINLSVYADHASTTPILPEALVAMLPWLKEGQTNRTAGSA